MKTKLRKVHAFERQFLRLYSSWQETHRVELAFAWMAILGEILKLYPGYSIRETFRQAF